jgi:hypothetical protein
MEGNSFLLLQNRVQAIDRERLGKRYCNVTSASTWNHDLYAFSGFSCGAGLGFPRSQKSFHWEI